MKDLGPHGLCIALYSPDGSGEKKWRLSATVFEVFAIKVAG